VKRQISSIVAGCVLAAGLTIGGTAPAQQRSAVLATGSSTVAPFSQAVARALAETGAPAAEVRVVGTGGGFAEFCQGAGLRLPDVQNASRRITTVEFVHCGSRGVHEIMEIPIGYDGIVLAHRVGLPPLNLKLEQIWRGLARQVPQDGALVANPYTTWNQISRDLPSWPIRVIGPPGTSGTRDSFIELGMLPGCQAVPEVRSLPVAQQRRVCAALRDDGRWIDGGEDDDAIVRQVVEGEPVTLGVFGYSFLETNRGRIVGAAVEGVQSDRATIAAGQYPLSRPLFLYVKRPNLELVAGLKPFLDEYMSDRAMGPGGYLTRLGLVPLDPGRLRLVRESVANQAILLRSPQD